MNTEELADLERHTDDMYINRIMCTPKTYKIVFDESVRIGKIYLKTSNSDFESRLRTISDYKQMLLYLDQNENKFTELFDVEQVDEVIDLTSSIQTAIENDKISLENKLV